ncbi:MAG: hypothetical protein ACF8LL_12260, partial [Phycisphaerales bacterium]
MTPSSFPSCRVIRASDPPIDSASGLPIPPAGHGDGAGEDDSFSGGMDSAMRRRDADSRAAA